MFTKHLIRIFAKTLKQENMKKSLLSLSLLFAIFTVNAQVLLHEPFDYTVGDSLVQHGWTGVNTGDSAVITTGSLSINDFAPSTGNKLSFAAGGRDYQKTFTSQTSGTVYMSFIVQVTDVSALTSSSHFVGFAQNTTDFGSSVWAKKGVAANTFAIGLNARSTLAYTSWSSTELPLNTPILVVVSYQMISETTNDVVKMWINPSSSSFGISAPTENLNIVNGGTDFTQIDRIYIRQGNFTSTPAIDMDEVRVGLTWAEVVPSASGIQNIANVQSFQVYPNPATTQVTVSVNENIQSVQIFDLQGRMVNQVANVNAMETNVNIENLSQGIYNIVATSNNGTVYQSKMIK